MIPRSIRLKILCTSSYVDKKDDPSSETPVIKGGLCDSGR